jgi:hypothetical protein
VKVSRQEAPPFSLPQYEARRGEILLHMSHFCVRYLSLLYHKFDGDLALVIVLGEISHHNTAKFFSPHKLTNERVLGLQEPTAKWDQMDGCNAFSLSSATGIPRETVRRKVLELKKRGWIEEVPKEGLRITRKCADHFGPNFSITILSELLEASRAIEQILRPSIDEPSLSKRSRRNPPKSGRSASKSKDASLPPPVD